MAFIKSRIQETAFQTWFDGIKVSALSKEDITVLVPNKFHYEWLESKYRLLIDEAIQSVLSYSLIVNYTVPITKKSASEIPSLIKDDKSSVQVHRYHKNNIFNARYTFETFIEGKDNQFAKAACTSVSDSPGNTPFNPLLIYSATGLGKTHLLQAIGNLLIKRFPNYNITYLRWD